MTVDATRRAVIRNPCASTAATLGTATTLILYGASAVGVTMPYYVGTLIGTLVVSGGLAFPGLRGIWRFILYGRGEA